MSYLGEFEIGSNVPFNFQALDGYGQAIDADDTPTYEVYVNNAPMDPAVTGDMTKINGQTGFYGGVIAATAANGFVAGNTYTIRISATIDGVPTLSTDTFQLSANSATTTTASFTPSSSESNDIEVDAENPFDAAAINSSGAFKSAFGKRIVILPDGVTERTVTAIISYDVVSKLPGTPHGTARKITITVDNNAITGLSADEFDKANATCRIPKTEGASASEAKIVDILKQDAGMVTYEVR